MSIDIPEKPCDPLLYGYFRSTAAYRVRIALGLKGVAAEHRFVHLRIGEQNEAAYLNINPAGLVPYWVDGELQLAQSLAIIEYLDETRPQPPLLPTGAAARAVAREIAFAVCSDIHPIGNLRVLKRLGDLGIDDTAGNKWSQHWISIGFEALEKRLASIGSGPYTFGTRPTLPDICIVPQVFNARRFGVDLAPYPCIRVIDAAASQMDAFAAAAPDRQLDAT